MNPDKSYTGANRATVCPRKLFTSFFLLMHGVLNIFISIPLPLLLSIHLRSSPVIEPEVNGREYCYIWKFFIKSDEIAGPAKHILVLLCVFHVFPFFLTSSQCPWAPCFVRGTRVEPDEHRSLCHRSHFQPQSFCDSLIIYLEIVNSSFLYSYQYTHKITKWENRGIIERSELDGTHKNHWVQRLAPHKTIKKVMPWRSLHSS